MRNRILTEALNQMNEQGLRFTTAGLAHELAVSKRTIYEHFSSKENLMGAVFEAILADLHQQVSRIFQNEKLNPIEKLRSLMTASPKALGPLSDRIIDDAKRLLPKEWAKFEDFFTDKWMKIEQVIRQGEQEGLFRPVNLVVLRKMYMGTINELGDYQFLAKNSCTFSSTMATTIEILIFGLIANDDPDKERSSCS